MARESLGTVRLHRFTCDHCETTIESRSKASGAIPLPSGWSHVELKRDDVTSSADVCSPACAVAFAQSFLDVTEGRDATTA